MSDAVTNLIQALSFSGIPFERDAWWDANNTLDDKDYGIVELTGAPSQVWGDDTLIYQDIKGNVILYVADGSDQKAKAVQDILISQGVSFQLVRTQYLPETNQNCWTWSFDLEEYLNGEA